MIAVPVVASWTSWSNSRALIVLKLSLGYLADRHSCPDAAPVTPLDRIRTPGTAST